MYSRASKYLSDHGIRPSIQRAAVMDYLMKNKTHPTVDEIYEALLPRISSLSRMTVHNTLTMLTAKGVIHGLDLGGGCVHYDGDISHHAHFICTHCGVIRDLQPNDHLVTMYTATPPPGVTFTRVQLTYKGFCEKCNETNDHFNNN